MKIVIYSLKQLPTLVDLFYKTLLAQQNNGYFNCVFSFDNKARFNIKVQTGNEDAKILERHYLIVTPLACNATFNGDFRMTNSHLSCRKFNQGDPVYESIKNIIEKYNPSLFDLHRCNYFKI